MTCNLCNYRAYKLLEYEVLNFGSRHAMIEIKLCARILSRGPTDSNVKAA